MNIHVALLRAINVGGTGKLAMADLRALCTDVGFTRVRTYIQSGNVVLESPLPASKVKTTMETSVADLLGGHHPVLVRSGREVEQILLRNPFPDAAPNQVLVHFLDEAPAPEAIEGWPVPGREELVLDGRELFLHYPDGMGRSKLKIPFKEIGTARNLRTVAKLADMVREVTR